MKLSEYTSSVLKNFSTINSNIVITKGNRISTISEARNILGTSVVDTEFASEFGLYDLGEFLNVTSLVNEPEITIEEKNAIISDATGRSKIKYFFTDKEMLTAPSDDMLEKAKGMSEWPVEFILDMDTLNRLKRAAQTLGHSSVSVTANGGSISLTVFDPENPTSNSFSIDVPGKYRNEAFNLVISISNLKILPGDYQVGLSSKLMSKFQHTEKDITYWIALEKSSTYGE